MLTKLICKKIIDDYLKSFYLINDSYFYRYFIGTISLVCKDWYQIVFSITIESVEINSLDIQYIHHLLKKGIVIKEIDLRCLLIPKPSQNQIHDILELWKINMGLNPKIVLIGLGLETLNLQIVQSKYPQYITYDTLYYRKEHLSQDKLECCRNMNRQYKHVILDSIEAPSILSNFHSIILKFSVFSIRDYQQILLNNPQLEKLTVDIEYILDCNGETLFTPELVNHKHLKEVKLELIDYEGGYSGETLLNVITYLNANSVIETLMYTPDLAEEDCEGSGSIDSDQFRIYNSTLKILYNVYDFRAILILPTLYSMWSCKSSIESAIYPHNYMFSDLDISSLIQYHNNVTTLVAPSMTSVDFYKLIQSLPNLTSLTFPNVIGKVTLNLRDMLYPLKNLRTLHHPSPTINQIITIVELNHPSLTTFGFKFVNVTKEVNISNDLETAFQKNDIIKHLHISHVNPQELNYILTNILPKSSLQSLTITDPVFFSNDVKSIKNIITEYYQRSVNNNECNLILPDRLNIPNLTTWEILLKNINNLTN
ncbi:hypothetical protein DLAC_06363 [Tieghemostelium lacteum]|uniref:Uncharacterized protein n=1 Tax=Tieghemostelium lacteum TaxID=361077 RepID=A0A151ZEK5_TIELA|nr:hypothetical protein DLAC_06363 [Tieghemostelium lacteum]|eukprot:KYQ92392.1 hypothetical protein DLAC_06363 [Tieghemostelium lacteum]